MFFLQATKTKAEITQNIKGVFEVNRPDWIAEKKFLLADDVFITGATANGGSNKIKDVLGRKNLYFYSWASDYG